MRTVKYATAIKIWVFIMGCACCFPIAVSATPPAVQIHAAGAALVDVESGRIVWSSHGDEQMRIASLTKIMTAIVAIENGDLTDQVAVGKNAFGVEGSSIYLKLGEKMSLQNMLYGLMLRSGNDAAVAIAEHVGGSIEGFVYLMNQKAEELGLRHTKFANPHGLDTVDHYSSANDMAVITAYALRNPVFRDIVKTKIKKAPNPNDKWNYSWLNKNKMLQLYDGADGVKTGYTRLAKRCLVSSATRNGQQLAVVTLNDPNDWADHAKLLNYGFEHYPNTEIVKKQQVIEGDWTAAASLTYPLEESEKVRVTTRVKLNQMDSVAYKLGAAGQITAYLDDRPIGSVPLVAGKGEKSETGKRLEDVKRNDSSAFELMKENAQRQYDKKPFWSSYFHVVKALFTLQN